jgi:hypothetical protein
VNNSSIYRRAEALLFVRTRRYLPISIPPRFSAKASYDRGGKIDVRGLDGCNRGFQRYAGAADGKSLALFNNAAGWISSRDTAWPFSFENICESLRLNPDYLRLGLVQWRNKRVHRKPGSKRLREPLRYQYRVRHRRVSFYGRAEQS